MLQPLSRSLRSNETVYIGYACATLNPIIVLDEDEFSKKYKNYFVRKSEAVSGNTVMREARNEYSSGQILVVWVTLGPRTYLV